MNRPGPGKGRQWRLWQVESSLACNLHCVMCPWTGRRRHLSDKGHMPPAVWQRLVPYLDEVGSVDFSGGGEPLLQPRLFDWIRDAAARGCETGFLTNGLLLSDTVCQRVLDSGLDWIGISVDGADRATYEAIRRGSDFHRVCGNIRSLTGRRRDSRPRTLINFVLMHSNHHQMEEMVRLAHDLGIDRINFKHCDVIRGDHGKGHGLFQPEETRQIRQLKKSLNRARKLAERLGVEMFTFSFHPEELPVCIQDPRDSLFVRYNGGVSPCINLAMGGRSIFLGKEVVFPQISYGSLPQASLSDLWESEACREYRRIFSRRVAIHDATLAAADLGHDLIKLRQAFRKAIEAMPTAPDGCSTCHYLYDI